MRDETLEEESSKRKTQEEEQEMAEKTQKGKTKKRKTRGTEPQTESKATQTDKKTTKKKRQRLVPGDDVGGAGYKRYVFKVLKQVHPELVIPSKAMPVINTFMSDMFERIAEEALKLSQYSRKMTLSSREIKGTVRLVLPGELRRHAVAEGEKAVSTYMAYDARKSSRF